MKPPDMAHGLLLHYFHGPGYPRMQGSLSTDDFRQLLDVYGSRLINADIWIKETVAGTDMGDLCCVTLDDGLIEAYDLALPILRDRGLTAAWNIYSGPLIGIPNKLEQWRRVRNIGFEGGMNGFYGMVRGRYNYSDAPFWFLRDRGYLTDEDRDFRWWRDNLPPRKYEVAMERLAADAMMADACGAWLGPVEIRRLITKHHVIGAHTHSHPLTMNGLSEEQQALEYATSKFVLETVAPNTKPVDTMSHPRGSATQFGQEWLQANGFRLAWGATMDGKAPWNTPRWSSGFWRI